MSDILYKTICFTRVALLVGINIGSLPMYRHIDLHVLFVLISGITILLDHCRLS